MVDDGKIEQGGLKHGQFIEFGNEIFSPLYSAIIYTGDLSEDEQGFTVSQKILKAHPEVWGEEQWGSDFFCVGCYIKI